MALAVIWTLVLNGLALAAGFVASEALGFRRRGLMRCLAAATLAWAWVTLGLQILGESRQMNRLALCAWSLVGALFAVVLVAIARRCGQRMVGETAPAIVPATRWELPTTLSVAVVIWACLVIGILSLVYPVLVVSDAPIYHLYFAARWWQEGRVFLIASPFGESAATYFPANGDLWFAWLMTGWGGDMLARIGQAPFLLLSALAVYQLCRSLGCGTNASIVAACWFVGVVPLLLWSFVAIVDTFVVAGYLVAIVYLHDYSQTKSGAGALAVAGLAAGLAWGTKMTSHVFIPPLLLLGMVLVVASRRRLPVKLLHLVVLGATCIVPTIYWFARNLWLTGNPLYPTHLEAFGRVWLAGWYPSNSMRYSQFWIPFAEWRAFVDTLVLVLDFRLLPLWVCAILGAWTLGIRRTPQARWLWLISFLALMNVALFWVAIPYRTQQRFLLHALGLAAVPLAMLFNRALWLRWLGAALLAVHLVTPYNWPFLDPSQRPPWSMTRLIPTMAEPLVKLPLNLQEWKRVWGDENLLMSVASRLGLGVVAVSLAIAWARASARTNRAGVLLASGVSLVAALTGACWFAIGLRARELTYPAFEYHTAWTALERLTSHSSEIASDQEGWKPEEFGAPATRRGSRIAYAGTNLPYYLLGRGLRNSVRYVNVDEHRDWLMHDYHLSAPQRGDPRVWNTPRPGWDRLHPNLAVWLANLRAAGIQYLVVARANPSDGPFNIYDSEGFTIERAWAESRPDVFQPVYGTDPPDPRIKIYRLNSPTRTSTD